MLPNLKYGRKYTSIGYSFPQSSLRSNVTVEAFCVVGPKVQIGDDSVVFHHSTIEGDVEMGDNNEIFPYAMIGGLTHDLKFEGGSPNSKLVQTMFFVNM